MQSLRQTGETERAAAIAETLVGNFPNNPHASTARALLRGKTTR
jgi:hypothetical protein